MEAFKRALEKVFVDSRYGSTGEKVFYWGVRIGGVVLLIIIILIIIGKIYCSMKGIPINSIF